MATMTNAQLREALEAARAEAAEAEARALAAEAAVPARAPRRGAGRAILSVVCIVLACLLAPVALVAAAAGPVLTDTDRFVAVAGPILRDPAVQDYVATQATDAIVREVDVAGVVDAAFDGLTQATGLPARAAEALGLLRGTAVEAIESLIDSTVRGVLASDQFDAVWNGALRVGHAQLIATLSGDPAAIARIGDDGVLSVPLGPIVAEVRARLLDEGVGIARLIPDIDASIELVQSDALPALRLAYGIAVAASVALPIACLLLLAAGVLVARRRWSALVGAGIGLGIAMGTVAAAIGIAGGALAILLPGVPIAVSGRLFWAVAGLPNDLAIAVLVLAVAAAVVAWYAGPSRSAARLRGAADEALGAVRGFGEARGLSTGRVGRVLHEQRWLVRAAIAAVAAVVLVLARPLTPALVLWTVALALLALLLAELLRRPAG